jgi:MOSC domain-containing protein YiiM
MKLLSVNVALPKVIITEGRRVETGIFKKPVAGPVKVERLNLAGDRQADLSNHGGEHKAVYAYTWENVEFWQKALRRNDLGPGSVGENLTVEGLSDSEVAIGDEFAIGSAHFQVTQPRIPCYKLGLALGLADFPKQFLESGRTGFYLRVLREGYIAPGDNIRRIGNQEVQRVTVAECAEVVRTLAVTGDQLHRILSLRALPSSWRGWLEKSGLVRG